MSEAKSEKEHRDSPKVLGLVLLVVVAVFWQTIFLGRSISRVDMIAAWDTLFKGLPSSPPVGIEEAPILLFAPYHFLVANLWRAGEIPLWNPYHGLGAPLLANPHAAVLSPIYLPLIANPTLYTFNLILVMQLLLLATGMFLFARQLSLSRIAAAFAALTAAFCPYYQWYLEMFGCGYCLIPFLFCCFARLAIRPSAVSALMAGCLAALVVMSAHPEVSFCAVMSACAFWLLLQAGGRKDDNKEDSGRKLSVASGYLILAGVTAVCLAAPMLFPTIEYLLNSESYKFGTGNSAYLRWEALVLNLVHPVFGGASPYYGVCAFLFLPFCLFWSKRRTLFALLVLDLVLVGLSCRLPLFDWLFTSTPLHLVTATYFIPTMVCITTTLCAVGFDRIIDFSRIRPAVFWPVFSLMCTIIVAARPVVKALKVPLNEYFYDYAATTVDFARNVWTVQCIVVAFLFLLLLLRDRFCGPERPRLWRAISVVLLTVGVATQLHLPAPALPVRVGFDFTVPETIEEIIKSNERENGRAIAIGGHLMKPNGNLFYGIRDFRLTESIFPDRFITFSDAAGANLSSFWHVLFDLPLSPLISVAGIRNIVSLTPVFSQELAAAEMKPILEAPLAVDARVKVVSIDLRQLTDQRALMCRIGFETSGSCKGLQYQTILLDEKHNPVWWDDPRPVPAGEKSVECLSVPIAKGNPAGRKLLLGLRFFDSVACRFIPPEGRKKENDPVFVIREIVVGEGDTRDDNSQFRLLSETEKGVRLYENPRACPDVFVAHKAELVSSREEALAGIQRPDFDPLETVLLEQTDQGAMAAVKLVGTESQTANSASGKEFARIVRKTSTSMEIEAELNSAGVLVVSNIFYPGWEANVDGRATPIMHANYVLQSISLPAGQHKIEIRYRPQSFMLGALVFVVFCGALSVFGLFRWRRRQPA